MSQASSRVLEDRRQSRGLSAASGATDCDGIRKTMKYELAAQPFVLQVSGAKDSAISIAVLPSE